MDLELFIFLIAYENVEKGSPLKVYRVQRDIFLQFLFQLIILEPNYSPGIFMYSYLKSSI